MTDNELDEVVLTALGFERKKDEDISSATLVKSGIAYDGLTVADAIKMEILLEKFCSVIRLPTYQNILRTDKFIGVPIKSSNTTMIPQRFIYPSSEEASNTNFPGYVDQFVSTPIHSN